MLQVLIVDDEPYIRQGLRILIPWGDYGFHIVDEASNGNDAIEKLKENHVDLVITDIRMPRMSGLDLMEYVSKHVDRKIKFILLSGYYDFEYAKKAIKYEAANYILKPVEREDLIEAILAVKDKIIEVNNSGAINYTETIVNSEIISPYDITSPSDITYHSEIKKEENHNKVTMNEIGVSIMNTSASNIKYDTVNYHLEKERLDNILNEMEEQRMDSLDSSIDELYQILHFTLKDEKVIQFHLDYLLMNIIELVKKISCDYKDNEMKETIYRCGFYEIQQEFSKEGFKHFIIGFAQYIGTLRQQKVGGILNSIRKEIISNYSEPLSLKMLGEKYYVNSAYLGQIFRKQYGASFKDYLNNYRIEKSIELLKHTEISVGEISMKIGFNSTDYFISKFVEAYEVTPLQYRKQYLLIGTYKN